MHDRTALSGREVVYYIENQSTLTWVRISRCSILYVFEGNAVSQSQYWWCNARVNLQGAARHVQHYPCPYISKIIISLVLWQLICGMPSFSLRNWTIWLDWWPLFPSLGGRRWWWQSFWRGRKSKMSDFTPPQRNAKFYVAQSKYQELGCCASRLIDTRIQNAPKRGFGPQHHVIYHCWGLIG